VVRARSRLRQSFTVITVGWARSFIAFSKPVPIPIAAERMECVERALLLIRLANPKGIVSSSPGLRGTSYPGFLSEKLINPNGVVLPPAAP
jgi:hypothetical protein